MRINERRPLTDFLTNMSEEFNIYLLGRIWADGHISKTSVHLYGKVEDCEDLLKFFPNSVNFYKRQRTKDGQNWGKPSYDIILGGLNLKDFLTELDFKEKSSKSPSKILSKIENSKHYLFWRGFFDGDGSLSIKRRNVLGFWGSESQDWTDLENLLNSLGVEFTKIKYERKGGRHKSSCLEIRKMEEIDKMMSYIYTNYENYPLGIGRKYNEYKKLIEKIKNKRQKYGKYKGVVWFKNEKKWGVFIYSNGEVIYLGKFKEEEQANLVRLNFMKENNLTDNKIIRKSYTIIGK